MKIRALAIAIFVCAVSLLPAQGILQTNGKAIVNESGDTILLRGMGLGGWMLQEGYMLQTASFANPQYQIRAAIEELIGEENTDIFYDAWLANHVTKADIDSLKAWGFNSVRLPMHYKLFTLPIEEEPIPGEQTWLETGFILTDSLISWCAQNEMWVVLDLHGAPGGQGYDEGISDYDPTKPSLWESTDNQDKTVALWRRLAERYANETWVAGYDLINEPNWDLPGGTLLRQVYGRITDAIREVDQQHIIFIEGNWFANDFTGLTPPWDDNMVYSPHKYWSFNDQGSIQWVLDMREQYNVPLYLGESGENSNTWFKDAITLLETNEIGWAWWPMKKIESVAGPLSVIKTPEYQQLLNYWENGGSTPDPEFARATLMEITDNLLIGNCIYQKDVIDAMFRQQTENTAKPFNTQSIPGVVYPTDFDMGEAGVAYSDETIANYQVSTGQFTAWNQGWAYRNDGVDIERSSDPLGNGYNVGWIEDGEWMQYDVNVETTGVYEVRVRVASQPGGGNFNFVADGAAVSIPFYVSSTGGWQTWEDRVVPNVILDSSIEKLQFHAPEGGYNLSRFEFIYVGPTTGLPTQFLSAFTINGESIQVNLNKPLMAGSVPDVSDFTVYKNGNIAPITNVMLHPDNTRSLQFTVDDNFVATDVIKVSYNGDALIAIDETPLNIFILKTVENTLSPYFPIPGRIEAENYSNQFGIQLEETTDTGGGFNIGFLDVGDVADYLVNVTQSGVYDLAFRTAAESATGGLRLLRMNEDGSSTILGNYSFSPTGGWQSWATTDTQVTLLAGEQRLRIEITASQFNINWFDFSLAGSTAVQEEEALAHLQVFPNPSPGQFRLQATVDQPQPMQLKVFAADGQLLYAESLAGTTQLDETLNLHFLPTGNYHLLIRGIDGKLQARRTLIRVD
ncbi:MAG: cellulase family glycosylhydrolase [Bacteroidota bacterium]